MLKFKTQINYCGQNTHCNNHPGTFECNEDDCKDGYTNWRANHGSKVIIVNIAIKWVGGCLTPSCRQ